MNQYFLKFASKEEAIAQGLLVADASNGEIIKQTKDYFIDVVGVIPSVTQTGLNEEGEPVFTSTDTDGYHINVLIEELPVELEPYQVAVSTPYRVFAGA